MLHQKITVGKWESENFITILRYSWCKCIVGTPYEGGVFKCKLVVDSEFPQKPPKGKLLFFSIISFAIKYRVF